MACGVHHRTRKGLIADKIVSVFEELVLFTGLKIFTAQSKRRPRGEGNVSLGIKTLASPMEARTVGMGAAHYLGGRRTVAARCVCVGAQEVTQASMWQIRALILTSSWGNAGQVGSLAPSSRGGSSQSHLTCACDGTGVSLFVDRLRPWDRADCGQGS